MAKKKRFVSTFLTDPRLLHQLETLFMNLTEDRQFPYLFDLEKKSCHLVACSSFSFEISIYPTFSIHFCIVGHLHKTFGPNQVTAFHGSWIIDISTNLNHHTMTLLFKQVTFCYIFKVKIDNGVP